MTPLLVALTALCIDEPVFLRLEALQVLLRLAAAHTKIFTYFFDFVFQLVTCFTLTGLRIFRSLWPKFSAVLLQCITDPESRVRLQACRVLEAFTKALCAEGASLTDDDDGDETDPTSAEPQASAATVAAAALTASAPPPPPTETEFVLALWQELLAKHIAAALLDETPLVRASVCTMYSHIPPAVFAAMPVRLCLFYCFLICVSRLCLYLLSRYLPFCY